MPKRIISEDNAFFYVVQKTIFHVKQLNDWHWDFWTPLFSQLRKISPRDVINIKFYRGTDEGKRGKNHRLIIMHRIAIRKTPEILKLRELYPGNYLYVRDPKNYKELEKYLPHSREKWFSSNKDSYLPQKIVPKESLSEIIHPQTPEFDGEEEIELTNVIPPKKVVESVEEYMLKEAVSAKEDEDDDEDGSDDTSRVVDFT